MAVGGVLPSAPADANVSYYRGKLTWRLTLAIFVSVMGGALFGYDLGVSGGVSTQPNFLAKFFPGVHEGAPSNAFCKFNDESLQMFTASLYLAAAVAGLVANFTTRRLGRVNTMGIGGLFFLAGAALTGGAEALAMLILGRLSLGVGVGMCAQAVPTYLAEVSPPNWRGALSIMFQLAITLGIFVAQLINYGFTERKQDEWTWRVPLFLAGIPALILCLGWFVLPESPNGLVERGRLAQAEANLKRLRGTADVAAEFKDLTEATHIKEQDNGSWTTIFRRQYRPELWVAILIPLFQQFTGINSIMFYAPQIFSSMGLESNFTLLNTVIVGGINVGATFVAVAFVDRWGRRALFLLGGLLMLTMEVLVCAVLYARLDPTGQGHIEGGWSFVVLVAVCLFTAAFAFSWGPLGWLVPSEIQSLQTRSGGMAITTFVNFLATFIVGQSFLSMMCSMKSFVYLFFAICVTIMSIYVFFLLPETKRVPVEEMPLLWAGHWYWRRYAAADCRPLPRTLEMETQTGPSLAALGAARGRVHPSSARDDELSASVDSQRDKRAKAGRERILTQ